MLYMFQLNGQLCSMFIYCNLCRTRQPIHSALALIVDLSKTIAQVVLSSCLLFFLLICFCFRSGFAVVLDACFSLSFRFRLIASLWCVLFWRLTPRRDISFNSQNWNSADGNCVCVACTGYAHVIWFRFRPAKDYNFSDVCDESLI